MKLYENRFEPYSEDGVYIDVEEDVCYSGWWKNRDYPLLYTYTKDLAFARGRCLAMYVDEEIEGYCDCMEFYLDSDRYGYSKYDRFLMLRELGSDRFSKSERLLIENLIRYGRYLGTKFIKISTKESFPEFYKFIEGVGAKRDEDSYILAIPEPIDYEDFAHMRVYEGDALTMEDLQFLQTLGLQICESECILLREGVRVTIDRKSGLMTIPDWVCPDEPMRFCKEIYSLVFCLSREMGLILREGLKTNVKIEGLPYRFAMIGKKLPIIFYDLELDSKNYFDILYRMHKYTDCEEFKCYTANLHPEIEFYNGKFYQRSMKKALKNARICLDSEICYCFPTPRMIKEAGEFEELIKQTESFGIKVVEVGNPDKSVSVFFDRRIAKITIGQRSRVIENIDTEKYREILRNANLQNWKASYPTSSDNAFLSWGMVLNTKKGTRDYRGTNGGPKALRYFINELLEA